MHFIALTSLFMASTALAGLPDYDYKQNDYTHCLAKHPAVRDAIERFCAKTDMVVPSPYATYGGSSRGFSMPWSIWIFGDCKPPQWVPQFYCKAQFYQLCASRLPGDGTIQAQIHQKFGTKNCQEWVITLGSKNLKGPPVLDG